MSTEDLSSLPPIEVPETMVERMAKALAPAAWASLGVGDTSAQKHRRTASIRHALAVLQVLAEPDGAMVEAGAKAIEGNRWRIALRQVSGEKITSLEGSATSAALSFTAMILAAGRQA